MRDLNELNINDGGSPVRRPAPTPEQFRIVENLIGTQLPPAYIEFLQFANGGHPELDTFEVNHGEYHDEWGVSDFFYILSDSEHSADLLDVVGRYHHRWPGAVREMLPIANDGGDNLFYLDLSAEGKGRVVVHIHDEPGFPIRPLANSFEEFIDNLMMNPDYI
jgi:hypothetical protein